MIWQVKIIKPGYMRYSRGGLQASSNIVLLKSESKNILIDTGGIGDGQKILASLKAEGLRPADIDYVILTHHHPDHSANNTLFAGSTFVDGAAMWRIDMFKDHDSSEYGRIRLLPGVDIVPTPGHSSDDCTILVETAEGKVAIVGDLVALKEDMLSGAKPAYSFDFELQKKSRAKILREAKFVVPGHGPMFEITPDVLRAR